jgi:hypothetical protein
MTVASRQNYNPPCLILMPIHCLVWFGLVWFEKVSSLNRNPGMKGGRKNLKRAAEENKFSLQHGHTIMQVLSLPGSNLIQVPTLFFQLNSFYSLYLSFIHHQLLFAHIKLNKTYSFFLRDTFSSVLKQYVSTYNF